MILNINVAGQVIEASGRTDLFVQNESEPRTIKFIFNSQEHAELSDCTFRLWYQNNNNEMDFDELTKDTTGPHLILSWIPKASTTSCSGRFVFNITAYRATQYVWKTKACAICVPKDIDGMPLTFKGNLTEMLEDFESRIEALEAAPIGNLVFGYYFNGQFYKDSEHTTLITPDAEKLYFDKTSGATNKLYTYNGSSYQPFSSVSKWSEIEEKPFQNLGSTLKSENGVLNVNTVDVVQTDNTLPITSNGVAVTVGNINALLQLI